MLNDSFLFNRLMQKAQTTKRTHSSQSKSPGPSHSNGPSTSQHSKTSDNKTQKKNQPSQKRKKLVRGKIVQNLVMVGTQEEQDLSSPINDPNINLIEEDENDSDFNQYDNEIENQAQPASNNFTEIMDNNLRGQIDIHVMDHKMLEIPDYGQRSSPTAEQISQKLLQKIEESQTQFKQNQITTQQSSSKIAKKSSERRLKKKADKATKVVQMEKDNSRIQLLDKQLFEIANGVDQKLLKLSAQIEQLNCQFNIEKDGDDFLAEMQTKNFDSFLKEQHLYQEDCQILKRPLAFESFNKISVLPTKVFPLAEKLAMFKSQQEYIESLNLREAAHATFATISSCVQAISQHLDPDKPIQDDLNNYQLLSDLTQQREFMFNFNQEFKRVVQHIIELSTFLQKKEQSYIEQIESLSKQNQVLFDENITLQQRTIGLSNQTADLQKGILNTESSAQLLNNGIGSKEAAGIVTETFKLLLSRFDLMKQSIWDEDSSTCFYSEKLLQVPKKMNFIPVAEPQVSRSLSEGLDQIDQLRRLIRDLIERKNEEILLLNRANALQTERLIQMQKTVKQTVLKVMPRVSAILNVDIEYLKRTIQSNKTEFNDCILSQMQLLQSDYNDSFVSKINSLNSIVCHQQLLDQIENCQMQLNASISQSLQN